MRLIDAEALKEHKFVGVQTDELDEIPIKAYQQGWNDAIDAIIDNAPTVERPQGKWIFNISFWSCSVCKNSAKTIGYCGDAKFMNEFFKFCPNCGADMRKEEAHDNP